MIQQSNEQIAMRVSKVSILWNIILCAFKLFAGVLARSGAMISDAIHSASDVLSTVIVIVGVKISCKAADREHPYGHERIECIAALLLAAVLFATGLGIGVGAVHKIIESPAQTLVAPGRLALAAAVLSIVVKEVMYWYTREAAQKIHSSALMADAWHHRSDALSSVGSFVGIAGARLGYPILDPIASVAICILIVKASVQIFLEAVGKLTDHACDDQTTVEIFRLIGEQEGVLRIDEMNTRLFGDRIYVDVEFSTRGEISLYEAHGIAQSVHDTIEATFPSVKHCMVHVNPYFEPECGEPLEQ